MALENSFEDEHGIVHDNAYAKIYSIYANDLTHEIKIRVGIWINEQARIDGEEPIKRVRHDYQDETLYDDKFQPVITGQSENNGIEVAYEHIKQNEDTPIDWSNWSDV
jgi:hypothetical protein